MDFFDSLKIIFFSILGAGAILFWHRLTSTYTDYRNREIIHRNSWDFCVPYEGDDTKLLKQKYLFFQTQTNLAQLSFIKGCFQFRMFKLYEVVHSFKTHLLAVEIENLDKARKMEILSTDLPIVLLNHFRTKLVKAELDYQVFNKEFEFFKTEHEAQFYMLSPDMMEALLDLKSEIGPFGLEANRNSIFIFCAYKPYIDYINKSKPKFDEDGLEKEKIYKDFLNKIIKVDNKI